MKHTPPINPLIRGAVALVSLVAAHRAKSAARTASKTLLWGIPLLALPAAALRAQKPAQKAKAKRPFLKRHPRVRMALRRALPVVGGSLVLAIIVSLIVAPKATAAMLLFAVVVL